MPINKPKVFLICSVCETKYPVIESRAKKSKFCGIKCFSEHSQRRVKITCKYCEKVKEVIYSQRNKKYCNVKCMGLAMRRIKKMPKKNHIRVTGKSLGEISQRGDISRFSKYIPKKDHDLGGLHPKVEGKSPHPCNCFVLEKVEVGKNLYKCSNEFCGKLFRGKAIK